MKPTVTILVCMLSAGLAAAQSPSIIQNTRDTMNGVANRAAAASNQALGGSQSASGPSGIAHTPAKSTAIGVAPAKSKAAKSVASKHPGTPTVLHKVQPVAVVTKSVAPASEAAPESADSTSGVSEQSVVPDSKYAANGRRDPFISPVVANKATGSGCSTGKKCLEIGAINLRGVVHAESGFIAVVSNGLNKAYFLRENDPVFNGYVVKITGDSIVFQETLQDRLGKSFTREVTKKITAPAV